MLAGVLDANVIIGFAKGGVFELLQELYQPLFVPSSVVAEVICAGQGLPGAAELEAGLLTWIDEAKPQSSSRQRFLTLPDASDVDVLTIATEKRVDHVLSSDAGVYRLASLHGLTCLQATDILILLKQVGIIPAVSPILDRMRVAGFGIDQPLYIQAILAAGE